MMANSDPISLLGSFFRYSGQDFAAHNFAPAAELEIFVENGWLIRQDYPAAVVCDVCDDSHFANVIHDNEGAYAVCSRSAETFRVAQ